MAGNVGAGAASGAASGAALGPWGALAGAVIGGVGSYMGQKSEAERRAEAIKQYRARMAQINQAMLAALSTGSQLEQGGQLQAITNSGAPAMAAAGQSEAARQAAVSGRLAALTADQQPAGGATAPAAQTAAYQRAAGRTQLSTNAQNLLRLLGEQNRQQAVGARDAAVPYQAYAPALATSRTRYNIDAQDAQSALDSTLGTTGNGALNWQLLGALGNIGANAGWKYSAQAGT